MATQTSSRIRRMRLRNFDLVVLSTLTAACIATMQPPPAVEPAPFDAPPGADAVASRAIDRSEQGADRAGVGIVVGIDDYPAAKLRSAVSDARKMALLLDGLGYEVYEFYDASATRSGIEELLRQTSLLTENDQLVFYFAGHGHTSRAGSLDAMGYLVTADISPTDFAKIEKNGLSMTTLTRTLSETRAQQVLVLVDACYSGLSLPPSTELPQRSRPELQVSARLPVMAILTAGNEGQKAVEHRSKGGFFTSALDRGLTTPDADANRDDILTAPELARFVKTTVQRDARRVGREQTPQDGYVGMGTFVFPISRGRNLVRSRSPSGMVLVAFDQDAKAGLFFDSHEVTVAEYRHCMGHGACSATVEGHGKSCNLGQAGRNDHPVNCVTFRQAMAYCEWRRKRLPYESEWLAVTNAPGRRWPWGNRAPTCEEATFLEPALGRGCGVLSTRAVNRTFAGRSPEGVYDLVGNVREWLWPDGTIGKKVDPDLIEPHHRLPARGGSWRENLVVNDERRALDGYSDETIGFRCAVKRRMEGV